MNPKPYPGFNTEELEAIRTFEALIDLKQVKPEINRLDTRPNSDGTVELVDEEQRPIGKLEVQVKKVPDGATSYSCPMELIAYSEVISSPFLLICVDVANQKAYFCHLHPQIVPEGSVQQQSFTIKFNPNIHSISAATQYFRQWLEIAQDYRKRISDFPKYSDLVTLADLSRVSREDCAYFQDYIEYINRYLDGDLPLVKREYFKGVWKLGVAISPSVKDQIGFQLYTVPRGGPDVRVAGINNEASTPPWDENVPHLVSMRFTGSPQGNTVQYQWALRTGLKSAKEEASRFVFERLNSMLEAKKLPLFGKALATEYLFWYVDNYGSSLGVDEADRLNVEELKYGIYVYFQAWASLALPRFRGELLRLNNNNPQQVANLLVNVPIEHVARAYPIELRPAKSEVLNLIASRRAIPNDFVRFADASPSLLADAVDYLSGLNVNVIERPYISRVRDPKMIWGGYTAIAHRHNMKTILVDSLEDYRVFVERNQISLKKSKFLYGSNAIIYVADFERWVPDDEFGQAPVLQEYLVKNSDSKLPKISLFDSSQTSILLTQNNRMLAVDGSEKEIISRRSQIATEFFDKLPLLNHIYDMLATDLAAEYQYRFLSKTAEVIEQ